MGTNIRNFCEILIFNVTFGRFFPKNFTSGHPDRRGWGPIFQKLACRIIKLRKQRWDFATSEFVQLGVEFSKIRKQVHQMLVAAARTPVA